MATQDERITILEQTVISLRQNMQELNQFRPEAVKTYQDMAVEVTMQRGLAINAVEQLRTVRATLEGHTTRLDSIDSRLHQVDSHLEAQDTTLAGHTTRLDSIDSHIEAQDTTLAGHTTRLDSIDSHIDRVEALLTQILARLPEQP